MRARTIGFMFESFNLLRVLSAEENVEYPMLQFRELSKADRRWKFVQDRREAGHEDPEI